MSLMDAETGRKIEDREHLVQSIQDILTTRIGSRVMLREYGSRLPDLIDRPINRTTITEFYGVIAESLRRWEPRLRIRRVKIRESETDTKEGIMSLDFWADYLPTGLQVFLENVRVEFR